MRITALDVADEAEISYRQLDHWVRRGYLRPRPRHMPEDASGSGYPISFDDAELAIAVSMGALVRAGLKPDVAARLARALEADRVQLLDEHHYLVRVP